MAALAMDCPQPRLAAVVEPRRRQIRLLETLGAVRRILYTWPQQLGKQDAAAMGDLAVRRRSRRCYPKLHH